MVSLQERPSIQKITNFEQKFILDLCNIYDAEYRFLEAQQIGLQCAKNNQLRSLLETHIRETEEQIRNLEQVFNQIGQQPRRVNCEGGAGIVSECQKDMLLTHENSSILDLAMTSGQALVEQYEITCYKNLVKGAERMGRSEAVNLLRQNLQQEEQTARKIEACMPQIMDEVIAARR